MALLLTSQWYTFYVGYYPYMADPANPGVPDALFTLLLLKPVVLHAVVEPCPT